MRLLTLNLRHGGGRRVPALLAHLRRQEADVLVLCEHRQGPAGEALAAGLAAAGYVHRIASHDAPRVNHLLVASRLPLRPAPRPLLALDPVRLLPVRVGGLLLVGVHLPNLKAKLPHWRALLALAGRLRGEPAMYLGDFNSGHHVEDVQHPPFPFSASYEEYMGALRARGWLDAWRHLHPQGREFSWYSHRRRGFRLDHAFLSPACAPALRGAAFDHAVRESGASDHSALRVELAP